MVAWVFLGHFEPLAVSESEHLDNGVRTPPGWKIVQEGPYIAEVNTGVYSVM